MKSELVRNVTEAPEGFAEEKTFSDALVAAISLLGQKEGEIRHELGLVAGLKREIAELQSLIFQLKKMVPSGPAAASSSEFVQVGRGKPELKNIVQLVFAKPDQRWRVAEVQSELARKGVEVDSKYVHNAMQHLWERGALVRVQRGTYMAAQMGHVIVDPVFMDDGE